MYTQTRWGVHPPPHPVPPLHQSHEHFLTCGHFSLSNAIFPSWIQSRKHFNKDNDKLLIAKIVLNRYCVFNN